MEKEVEKFIKSHNMISDGDTVVIGVSGGADSMALLHVLLNLKDKINFSMIVAHVNHNLRKPESDEDERFVEDHCKKLGVEFKKLNANVSGYSKFKNISEEEAGRKIRYNFFGLIRKNSGRSKLATGHHKDDQTETVLMRIIRGTGIKGLKGIEAKREDGVIRPLLCVSKEDILEYCRLNNIPFRSDQTNFMNVYHRNKIRLDLIPVLKEYNPSFEDAIVKLAEISSEYDDYVETIAKQTLDKCRKENGIDYNKFSMEDRLIQKRVLLQALNEKFKTADIGSIHLNDLIDKIMDEGHTVWTMDLPGKITVQRSYDMILFDKENPANSEGYFEYRILPGKTYVFSRLGTILETEIQKSFEKGENNQKYDEIFLDYDRINKIRSSLIFRQRKSGDKIRLKGHTGKKKVKKILIDKKIPRQLRAKIPMLIIDQDIIWIPGIGKSDEFEPSSETKKILRLTLYKNQEEVND
ncbi:tRNA lysidine(34) synthetase TilS [Alkalibacter mobilis]|uniref:tRNA lysidine(34) synthetase TilS n=1 Tax=Alkalibacter mobilis TaxID=2787712 RepID=UPI00189EEF57|nr:tRNA lysidine(34) synthetase TilS [Alkalibacter mobilis]MBF7096918.1 tRNA lysidine(34) synthetase TilS [Alkalibacter mobilis]